MMTEIQSDRIVGGRLTAIPWSERPFDCDEIIWRYPANPIITQKAVPGVTSVLNSAVVPFNGGFAGVFRCDDRRVEMRLHRGFSDDGFHWRIESRPIAFQSDDVEFSNPVYAYDPRVVNIDGRFYISWCNGYHGPTIGLGYTDDFEKFHFIENAFLPYNRNGVLFPRKINGRYAMLSRPSDTGHTSFGDIFYSESQDLVYWGKHRWVMGPIRDGWQSTKIGAGPVPIETSEGWLLFYHGVLTSCNGYVYSFSAVLLDLEQPWKARYRANSYLLAPQEYYECVGEVPNVVFPCAALTDVEDGRIAIYYGGADSVIALCFTRVANILDFLKTDSQKTGYFD